VLVALALLVFLSNGFGTGSNGAAAIYAVVAFLFFWGYDVAFEVLASGRTPGKRWNGLRVVRSEGQPIGFLASATRNLLRLIDWLPSLYLVGMVSIFVTGKNQRLGDIVAGTVVVREHRAGVGSPRAVAPAFSAPTGASSAAWDVSAITTDELAAVRSFLDRRSDIDWNARNELATTIAARLRPKVAGVPDHLRSEEFLEQLALAKARWG
jgi:RDD family